MVIELATFVAGPSAGLALAQLGATVVRMDPLGGAVDVNRWPLAPNGRSLYWSALNRGKHSITLDLHSEAGREVALRLICAPGTDRGVLMDNVVAADWLSWEALSGRRADLIHIHIEGTRDGRAAVDYTVNAETGVPFITGPEADSGPVNHVLPAWDLLTGMTVSTALLAALRRRDRFGTGARVDIALADVALAGVANLGWFSEVAATGRDRDRQGNAIYGSYGRDFATADGRYVMVVALTPAQWRALVGITGSDAAIAALEAEHAVDLVRDESARYRLRAEISAILEPWFGARNLDSVTAALSEARVLSAPFRSLAETAAAMPGPLQELDQPGIGPVISATSPMQWRDYDPPVHASSALGADTMTVLAELSDLDPGEIDRLVEDGVIGPADA